MRSKSCKEKEPSKKEKMKRTKSSRGSLKGSVNQAPAQPQQPEELPPSSRELQREVIADIVQPVPESQLRGCSSAKERLAVKRVFRNVQRLVTQEDQLLRYAVNGDPAKREGGMAVADVKRRVPQRPTSAAVSNTPRSVTACSNEPQHANDASLCRVRTPRELAAFEDVVHQRRQLIALGEYDSAARVKVAGDSSRPESARTQPGPRQPQPPSAPQQPASVAPTPRSAEQTRLQFTPTERIGLLNSQCTVRTSWRDLRISPPSTRVTYRLGPPPAPPAGPCGQVGSGSLGADPATSHFLDANDFNDSDPLVWKEGTPSCIGFSKFYVTDEARGSAEITTVMHPCKIIGYSPEQRVYHVRWADSGKVKTIKPLNIKFHYESQEAYQARVARAEAHRNRAEELVRYEHFVNQIDEKSTVVPLSEEQWERVLRSVAPSIPKRQLGVVQKCIEDAEKMWSFGIRAGIANYRLSDPREQKKLELLRLPIPAPSRTPDLRGLHGTIAIPAKQKGCEFQKVRKFIAAELFVAHPALYRTLRYAVNRWLSFEHMKLVYGGLLTLGFAPSLLGLLWIFWQPSSCTVLLQKCFLDLLNGPLLAFHSWPEPAGTCPASNPWLLRTREFLCDAGHLHILLRSATPRRYSRLKMMSDVLSAFLHEDIRRPEISQEKDFFLCQQYLGGNNGKWGVFSKWLHSVPIHDTFSIRFA